MIRSLKQFFDTRVRSLTAPASSEGSNRALELATAALLIEVSRADFEVSEDERAAVVDAVQHAFGLSPEETEELVRLADEEVRASISLYEFTREVDQRLSLEQKKLLMELLFKVALADDVIEKHEEHLIRKISKLIHVRHQDYIQAKLKARDARR
jgi:uncharacterized tellurite resistance protein B-like protein